MTKQSLMLQRECFNKADFFVGPSRHDVARSHRVNTALLLCCPIISLRYRKLLKVLAKKTAGGRRSQTNLAFQSTIERLVQN